MTTLVEINRNNKIDHRASEFVNFARWFMIARGDGGIAASMALKAGHRGPFIGMLEKAASDPQSISADSALSQIQIANAFLASIASQSLFDAMLPSMINVPLRTKVVSVSAVLSAGPVA